MPKKKHMFGWDSGFDTLTIGVEKLKTVQDPRKLQGNSLAIDFIVCFFSHVL